MNASMVLPIRGAGGRQVGYRVAVILAVGIVHQLMLPALSLQVGFAMACCLVCVAGLYACVRCVRLGYRARGRRRGTWLLSACAAGLLGSANFCYAINAITDRMDAPVPRAGDVLAIGAAISAVPALIVAAPASSNTVAMLRRLLDVATVAGSIFALSWQFVLAEAARQGGPALAVMIIELIPEVAGASLALVLMSSSAPAADGYYLHLMCGGLGTFAVAAGVSLDNYQSGLAWYAHGTGGGFVVGSLLFAAATHSAIPAEDTTGRRHISGAWLVFPYSPVVLAIGSITVMYARTGTLSPVLIGVLIGTSVLASLRHLTTQVTTKQLVAALDERTRQLDRAAHCDALTGLANRAGFNRHAADLAQTVGPADQTALLMIDLDGFKKINDTLGHGAGDEVLIEVAQRLTGALRRGDTACRLGGDEFVVLLPQVDTATAQEIARRILTRFAAPMTALGVPVVSAGSVGITIVIGPPDIELAMQQADTALYAAKAAGKGTFRQFEAAPPSPTTGPVTAVEGKPL